MEIIDFIWRLNSQNKNILIRRCIVWGDQPGLKSKMDKLEAYQNSFPIRKEFWATKCYRQKNSVLLNGSPLLGDICNRCFAVQNVVKWDIPEQGHFYINFKN